MADHLLEVRNLSVEFHTVNGVVHAVRDISYHLDRSETLAILGESGSGKSVSSSAIMNLIDMPPGRITSGEILLDGCGYGIGLFRVAGASAEQPDHVHNILEATVSIREDRNAGPGELTLLLGLTAVENDQVGTQREDPLHIRV